MIFLLAYQKISYIPKARIPHKYRLYENVSRILRKHNIIPIAYMKDNVACVIKRGKDKTKLLENVNLVYRIKCDNCPSTYVGQTKRALFIEKRNMKKI